MNTSGLSGSNRDSLLQNDFNLDHTPSEERKSPETTSKTGTLGKAAAYLFGANKNSSGTKMTQAGSHESAYHLDGGFAAPNAPSASLKEASIKAAPAKEESVFAKSKMGLKAPLMDNQHLSSDGFKAL